VAGLLVKWNFKIGTNSHQRSEVNGSDATNMDNISPQLSFLGLASQQQQHTTAVVAIVLHYETSKANYVNRICEKEMLIALP